MCTLCCAAALGHGPTKPVVRKLPTERVGVIIFCLARWIGAGTIHDAPLSAFFERASFFAKIANNE